MSPLPYVVLRLSGLSMHERSLWCRPRNVTELTLRGVTFVNTGDTEEQAGQTAEVWVPPHKLDEWKKASA